MTFKNKSECINDFNINYTNPKHPIAFCGLNNIYKYYGGLLKVKEIGKLLASVGKLPAEIMRIYTTQKPDV